MDDGVGKCDGAGDGDRSSVLLVVLRSRSCPFALPGLPNFCCSSSFVGFTSFLLLLVGDPNSVYLYFRYHFLLAQEAQTTLAWIPLSHAVIYMPVSFEIARFMILFFLHPHS